MLPNETVVDPRATGPLADHETTSTAPSRGAAGHYGLGSQRPSSSKRPLGGNHSPDAESEAVCRTAWIQEPSPCAKNEDTKPRV